MNFLLGIAAVVVCFVFSCLFRMVYLAFVLQLSRADGRDGEYDEVFALFPIFVRGKLVWFRTYHRSNVGTLVGHYTTARLPDGEDKNKSPVEWPHLSLS